MSDEEFRGESHARASGGAATPARCLAEKFGDVEGMRALYAPDVSWAISASLGMPEVAGRDAVTAFNRQVWTEHHRPDCTVTILDELGSQASSAVRFIYRAFSLLPQAWYENEYTLFVKASDAGISRVTEAFDTAATIDFLARRPLGSGWAELATETATRVGALGREP